MKTQSKDYENEIKNNFEKQTKNIIKRNENPILK